MIRFNFALCAAALVAGAVNLAGAPGQAALFLGLQQDAGPIVTVASGPTPAIPLSFGGAFGNFEGISVSGIGQPGTVAPVLLQSSSLEVNNAGAANAGILSIYITSTDNTAPLGPSIFTSGFAAVHLVPGWSETLETYLDPGNGVYALTTALGSALFTGVDSETDVANADAGAGPFSVTAVYRITAPTLGSASSQVAISAVVVPEPGMAALLGAAVIGLGVAGRKWR